MSYEVSQNDKLVPRALAVLRVTLAVFFLVWSFEKILHPETTQAIFDGFYGVTITSGISLAIGLVQTAFVLAFLAGVAKTVTYGGLLLMHAVTVLVTWQQIVTPYDGINHLFAAAIPVLGALVALFLLRRRDNWLTLPAAIGKSDRVTAI